MQLQDWKTIETDIRKNKDTIIERLVDFALNDVLLFWSADEKVQKRQAKEWAPIIFWVNKTINTKFKETLSLETIKENIDTSLRLKEYLYTLTDKELSGFYIAALNMRSVLLALALVKGKINATKAFELSELEELYQANNWGVDPVAQARQNNIKNMLISAENYLHQ